MGVFGLEPPPKETEFKALSWVRWFVGLHSVLTSNKPLQIPPYTLATLPLASEHSGKFIDVLDATGGAKLCRSDGTDWKLVNTTTTVS